MFKTKEEAAEELTVSIEDTEQCDGCKLWSAPCSLDGDIHPNDTHYHSDYYSEPPVLRGVHYERLCLNCMALADAESITKAQAAKDTAEEVTPSPSPSEPEGVSSIETFRATKRKVTDKKEAAEICGCDVEDNFDHILVYCESLYIDAYDDGSYFLHISNRSYGKPLEELEAILFDWAKYEGYVTPAPLTENKLTRETLVNNLKDLPNMLKGHGFKLSEDGETVESPLFSVFVEENAPSEEFHPYVVHCLKIDHHEWLETLTDVVNMVEADTPSLSDPVDKYIGQECPRCCMAVLEKSLCGNVICPNEDEGAFEGGRCGFSTEGLDDEEVTPSPALSLDEKVKLVVAETSDKFGEALVKHFPEIKSGDFLMQCELDEVVEKCTRHWVEMNEYSFDDRLKNEQ